MFTQTRTPMPKSDDKEKCPQEKCLPETIPPETRPRMYLWPDARCIHQKRPTNIVLKINSIFQLDLRIGEPMQICIHRKDNSPKPVNHHLTLKEGPKVKSDNIRRFPSNDILQVGFTLQTSRINNKRLISTLSLGVLV